MKIVKSKHFEVDQITFSTAMLTVIKYTDEYGSYEITIDTVDLDELKQLLNQID